MDTITDPRVPQIEWTPVAETMLEQLSPEEQAEIRASIAQGPRAFDPSRLTLIEPRRPDERPFYLFPVTDQLIVFVARDAPDHLRILDVVRREQLRAFSDETDPIGRDQTQAALS
jgi:hypothetical protein